MLEPLWSKMKRHSQILILDLAAFVCGEQLQSYKGCMKYIYSVIKSMYGFLTGSEEAVAQEVVVH